MDRVVELEIPARPEFVGVARMAVGALAGIRPGLAYERIDDLRIVVSEACTSAIEMLAHQPPPADGRPAGLRLRCIDGPKTLEVRIEAPGSAFDSAFPASEPEADVDTFRISLIRALVDDAELRTTPGGAELCLTLHRDAAAVDVDGDDLPG
ncbi:MAG: serine/threonine-protein kinase RsbW [Actinomycetota bacterium]|jgi:anti-sigma regulatory factor (Ser/Thr protein kinase)|nr:serine/threonine-protein kinase RsbW [Actinomycetota bacterium]